MSYDKINERRNALEEIFFAKQNRELIEKMKAKSTQIETCKELAEISGIKDTNVLDKLYEAGVRPSTMIALSLLPLILVAWADGEIDQRERDAIIKAASAHGIDSKNPAYEHLNSWLQNAPPTEVIDIWQQYVQGLSQALSGDSFQQLHTDLINRTRAVANSAGGFLGLGSKTSAAEKIMIDKLDAVFTNCLKAG
ncbi:hypothetical protein [Fluviispira sanaruensis]|uniref:Uncharacterized protein n=1 Tax=Fluviispira sanaruensis TaxID=2493639 RepID=A0A4P2VIF9_FLUSA|nr:hypothetical protein [Fluviispira sanaruensis]BBH52893.1 hypothetical protein JCM31447_13360 [Fluviispira sanaruensis]